MSNNGLGTLTSMCIDPCLDWHGRSSGPVAVYCGATLTVLGKTEGRVERSGDVLKLRFGGMDFVASKPDYAHKWWILFAQ